MELMTKDAAAKARVHSIIDKFGCLPSITPMTTLPKFDPLEMAQALERNLEESAICGHTKITIHLDLADAKALAQALRRK